MSIPSIAGIAGILTEPEATATLQGKPILKLFIGMSDRKYNDQTNQWETSKSFAVEAIAWEDRAERFAQGLSKGDQVYIEGRLETQQWEDKNGGGNRSKPSLTLNVLRKLEKAQQQPGNGQQQGGNGQQGGQQSGGAQSGGWGNQPPQNGTQQGGGWNQPAMGNFGGQQQPQQGGGWNQGGGFAGPGQNNGNDEPPF